MFNKKLALLMEEKGIRQKELAEMTGISAGSISLYRNGRVKNPSRTCRKAIASALNVPVEYFQEPDGEEKPESAKVRNISPTKAARLMGISVDLVKKGLEQGTAKFGFAAIVGKDENGEDLWKYHISPKKFRKYQGEMEGR